MTVETDRLHGRVIRVYHDSGYGFIRDSSGCSRFFHARDVIPMLHFEYMQSDTIVTFIPIDMGKQNPAMAKGNGLQAIQVRIEK
jgi:hypothetical protein